MSEALRERSRTIFNVAQYRCAIRALFRKRARGVAAELHAILVSIEAGPVAQRLVQETHNLLVAGSNPAGPTTIEPNIGMFASRREFRELVLH